MVRVMLAANVGGQIFGASSWVTFPRWSNVAGLWQLDHGCYNQADLPKVQGLQKEPQQSSEEVWVLHSPAIPSK